MDAMINRNLPAQRIETAPASPADTQVQNTLWWSSSNIISPASFLSLPDNRGIPLERLVSEWRNFYALHQLLLSIGGHETCFPPAEEDIEAILKRGRFYPGHSRMMVGKPSQCHRNSCELWLNNRRQFQVSIATGYALSTDGLWRQHTWLIHRYRTRTQSRLRLIETTEKRLGYFGFEMTEEEAMAFCSSNGLY